MSHFQHKMTNLFDFFVVNLVPAKSRPKTHSSHSRAPQITVHMGTTGLAVPITTVAPANMVRNPIMMVTVTISSGSSMAPVSVGMVSGVDIAAVVIIRSDIF